MLGTSTDPPTRIARSCPPTWPSAARWAHWLAASSGRFAPSHFHLKTSTAVRVYRVSFGEGLDRLESMHCVWLAQRMQPLQRVLDCCPLFCGWGEVRQAAAKSRTYFRPAARIVDLRDRWPTLFTMDDRAACFVHHCLKVEQFGVCSMQRARMKAEVVHYIGIWTTASSISSKSIGMIPSVDFSYSRPTSPLPGSATSEL